MQRLNIWGALVSAVLAGCQASGDRNAPPGFELVYTEDFSAAESIEAFAFSDRSSWVWNSNGALELVGSGQYEPPHRSPLSISLIRDLHVGDFVCELDLMQTGREYGHRDLCLFFGFQSPSRYYYVHLATKPDAHAHNVFLVDAADRRALGSIPAEGIDWGESTWHKIRLERLDGLIHVFFDDQRSPVLSVRDTRLGEGRVGFGSFDDSGRVDNVRIWALPHSPVNSPSDDPFQLAAMPAFELTSPSPTTIRIEYLNQAARDAVMQPGFAEGYSASYESLDGLLPRL